MTGFTFTCACCGKEIDGLPDLAFKTPDYYFAMSEQERAERAEMSDDFCVIDDTDRFIRVVCQVPIIGTEERLGWGVWVSLSEENFERYRETLRDNNQSELGGMFGWFSNRLPGYPDTLNLKTTVMPQDGNQRPLLWINSDHADHPLRIEQQDGIDPERLGEIYAQTVCDSGNDG